MSPQALRPSRTTTRLQIPIPGDAGPADFVTDLGAAADRIDIAASEVPLITPAQLSQPPYDNPYDGQIVDLNVGAGHAITWRLRWRADIGDIYKWVFVGGPPLTAYDGTTVNPAASAAAAPPSLTVPRPGFYYIQATYDWWTGGGVATLATISAYVGTTTAGLLPGKQTRSAYGVGYSVFMAGVSLSAVAAGAIINIYHQLLAGTGSSLVRLLQIWPVKIA